MSLPLAPFFADVAGGPAGGAAWWVQTSDNVRIRVGVWRAEGTVKGTVLMFPGRTEYIEKYGETATQLVSRGYTVLSVDWRGQGLADRLLDDTRVGHVGHFTDYQKDIAAVLRVAREQELPKPWHVIGHSMGGAITLRAVMEGMPVQTCAFTGPMWGIYFSPLMKPLSKVTMALAPVFGAAHKNPPSTSLGSYVLEQEFDGNTLTRDSDMYQMMRDQLTAHPDLSLGAPSIHWLKESVTECAHLAERASPDMPCLTYLGTHEQIVDRDAIRARMPNWPRGHLVEVPGGEHEVLMEAPDVRGPIFDQLDHLFTTGDAHAAAKA
ncbi:alpha/beta hydrolase [Tropicibacter sp. Alg240-R139]|uniref:alpha/beta hydrolase n=1 Tax=Tropicibacter sp. Alg240-R139 TaxID=2305991 RepID=UPI0013E0C5CE|nr:alpha/beta hydrolase [Tropicibacter sp. Alg240-R139]